MSDRDNERRLHTAADDQVSAETETSSVVRSKMDLAFTTPTVFVELPSKGKFYNPASSLHGKETIEIKFMTAKEEDILTSKALIKNGLVLDRLMESIILDKSIKPSDLLVGDRNAILVDARITGFGSKYITSVRCPACEASNKFSFMLDENKKLTHGEIPERLHSKVQHVSDRVFSIQLPTHDLTVNIRLMNGDDEKSILKISEANKKNIIDSSNTQQLKLLIESLENVTDKATIAKYIDNMPLKDSKFLKEVYKEITPNIDLTQNFVCEACEYSADMEVPFNMEFFWSK